MDGRHPLGTIAQLWRYPVKSLAPELLDSARIVWSGFEGDRQTALFVSSEDHARSGKLYRGKEHNLLHTAGSTARAIELAAQRDVAIAAQDAGPYFDAEAVSIVFDTWLAELEGALGEALHPQRFRPNVYALAAPGFAAREADLVGTTVRAGDVALDIVAPIERCVTPTYDLTTGAGDPRIGRAIAQLRGNILGVYCTVRAEGTLKRGDLLSADRPL